MNKLQEIMNEVSEEQYGLSWEHVLKFMDLEGVEDLMKKAALRYATEVARHNLKRAAEQVDAGCELTITSLEIELI